MCCGGHHSAFRDCTMRLESNLVSFGQHHFFSYDVSCVLQQKDVLSLCAIFRCGTDH